MLGGKKLLMHLILEYFYISLIFFILCNILLLFQGLTHVPVTMAVAALSVYRHQEARGPVRAPQTPEETKSHVKGQQACVLPLKLNSLFGGYWIMSY